MNGLRLVLFSVNSEPPVTGLRPPLSFFIGTSAEDISHLLPVRFNESSAGAFKQAEEVLA